LKHIKNDKEKPIQNKSVVPDKKTLPPPPPPIPNNSGVNQKKRE
jgi:hypothetical protein